LHTIYNLSIFPWKLLTQVLTIDKFMTKEENEKKRKRKREKKRNNIFLFIIL